MKLRPAKFSDASLLFNWRNDPLTRLASVNTSPVLWAEHIAWLARTIGNPDRTLLVAEVDDGLPVGTVRIDQDNEMSWTVAPEHRRKGYGVGMVRMATPNEASAWIKSENVASQKIAQAAGFALVTDGPVQKWARAG
jgi:RimJ/RimL family protein N-acetyltransferase